MKKILLVEDNEHNITILLSILGEEYDIRVCTSAEDALSILDEDLPDLMIIDVFLGAMNGIEFCRIVKNSDYTRLIPVIILTAVTYNCVAEEGFKAGANLFLTKPYKPQTLQECIQRLLDESLQIKSPVDDKY